MNQSRSFRGFFALYAAALVFCLGVRIPLKLTAMDPFTGFYTGGGALPLAFNAVLGICIVGVFALYLLRQTDRDYPVLRECKLTSFFALLCGVAIALYQLEATGLPLMSGLLALNPGAVPEGAFFVVGLVLGWLTGAAFAFVGGQVLSGGGQPRNGLFTLAGGLWLMVLLVGKFNQYTTLTTISDNLLTVLFMVFCALFFCGHARTLGGFSRRDGRNYAIPAGLATSLCGALLVIPNWVWAAANGTLNLPAPMLGSFESVFVLLMSIYALLFVRHICLSIRCV